MNKIKPPKCCEIPMELKTCDGIKGGGVFLYFQCRKCGDVKMEIN